MKGSFTVVSPSGFPVLLKNSKKQQKKEKKKEKKREFNNSVIPRNAKMEVEIVESPLAWNDMLEAARIQSDSHLGMRLSNWLEMGDYVSIAQNIGIVNYLHRNQGDGTRHTVIASKNHWQSRRVCSLVPSREPSVSSKCIEQGMEVSNDKASSGRELLQPSTRLF